MPEEVSGQKKMCVICSFRVQRPCALALKEGQPQDLCAQAQNMNEKKFSGGRIPTDLLMNFG